MLGPTGHTDPFTRDRLPAAADWPDILPPPEAYPDWLNAGVELTDRMVERGFGDHIALIGPAACRPAPRASCGWAQAACRRTR